MDAFSLSGGIILRQVSEKISENPFIEDDFNGFSHVTVRGAELL